MTDRQHVFLSYSQRDAAHATRLRRLLSARSDVSLASSDDLRPGDSWPEVLRHRLAKSSLFVLLLSPETLDSSWLLKELGAAWALEKPILAVLAGTNRPLSLPVQLDSGQIVFLKDLRRPEDFDPWLQPVASAP